MIGKLQRAFHYALGAAALDEADVLLASFPKSGNTWVRFFLANLAAVTELEGREMDFAAVNRLMPELGVSNLLGRWPLQSMPRVVKTHKPFWPIFEGKRAVLVLRDPRDVMASFYHFELGKRRPRFHGDFARFLRHPRFGLAAWMDHTESWRSACGLCLRYEDLRADDLFHFRRLVRFLGMDPGEDALRAAVERSRFDALRRVEDRHGNKPGKYREGFRFTRKGVAGDWKGLFKPADLEYYRELKGERGVDLY